MHHYSKAMMTRFATTIPKGSKILDVGSMDVNGSFRFKDLLFGSASEPLFPECEYIGIDIEAGPNVDIVVPEYEYPFPDDHFDCIISGSCLEHVRKPWKWMKEVARILKPGGKLCVIVPNEHPYHEHPWDCWRVYPEGLKALFEDFGLTVVSCEMRELHDGGTHPILGKMYIENDNARDTIGVATK